MDISLATSKIGGLTHDQTENSDLFNEKFNYLGRFSYKTKSSNHLYVDTLFSSRGQILKGDVSGKYTYKKIDFNGNYEFIDYSLDKRFPNNLKTMNFGSSYKFYDNLDISAAGRYDLIESQMATTSLGLGLSFGAWDYDLIQEYAKGEREKFSLSAIYDDECTRLTFTFENRYQDVGSSAPVKSFLLSVQLKPFANMVFSHGGGQITF